MKLSKKPSMFEFNPNNTIFNPEIQGKRMKVISDDGLEIKDEKCFTSDGLFSQEIFGTFETDKEYACKCRYRSGFFSLGSICPKCGTRVEFIQANIDKCGWIDLSGNKYNKDDGTIVEYGKGWKIIGYIPYLFLEQVIGKRTLQSIISVPNIITIDGDIDEEGIKQARAENPENKYFYYGIMGLYNNYNEILDYYYNLHNIQNQRLYDFLKDPTEIFIDKIPVVSTLLRPAMRTADGLKLDVLNKIYINIIEGANTLNSKLDQLELIENATLQKVQSEFFQLSEEIMKNIKSKYGLIRKQICGSRVNFSSRNIITPARPGIGMNEISMPYLDFLILWEYEIINILHKVKNISYREAQIIHFHATQTFNEEIYNIMVKMITDNECAILLNRNPTISLGSILYMKVVEIKRDPNDYTLSLNNSILTLLAGDYDGDVLNIISLKDEEIKKAFKNTFSPSSLIIDSNTGNVNEALLPERDQILGINSLLY